MPTVRAGDINVYYETAGAGEPLVLIPYLAADQACYAFQVPEYAKHFTCISVDLRGAGQTDKPTGTYTTELFADDIARFMDAIHVERAHVTGLSLGAATGMWLAAKYPNKVLTLSLHSAWPKSDPYLRAAVEGWQLIAKALNSVPEMLIKGVLPWCLTPELYAAKPEYVDSLAAFVRSRPVQPLDAFMRQSAAVLAHDCFAQLSRITAPTQITFGRHDATTSTRFADGMKKAIRNSEVLILEGCSHAPIYEKTEEFNSHTLQFLMRNAG